MSNTRISLFAGSLLMLFATGTYGAEVEFHSDIHLLYDQVQNLPNGRRQLEGGALWANYGVNWIPDTIAFMTFGVGVRSSYASDNRKEEGSFLENERAVGSDLTHLFWNVQLTPQHQIFLGRQTINPFLSPMVWDSDLSPIGVAYGYDQIDGDNRFGFNAGRMKTRDIYNVDATIQFLDFQWEKSWSQLPVRIGIWGFQLSDLQNSLVVKRQNDVVPLVNDDFRLIGLNLGLSKNLLSGQINLDVSALENRALTQDNQAARVDLSFLPDSQGYQINYTYQRVQKNAVVAAFNDDDWWFASRMRGYRMSVTAFVSQHHQVNISYFNERIDSKRTGLSRILLEYQISL